MNRYVTEKTFFGFVVSCVLAGRSAIPGTDTLKRISIRYSGNAYSFQCGMQLLILGEK